VAQNLGLWVVGMPMYDFLFVIIELFSLTVTVDALQGKTCELAAFRMASVSLSQDLRGKGSSFASILLFPEN